MLTFSINNSMIKHYGKLSRMNLEPSSDLGREWLGEMVIRATMGKVTDDVNVNAYGYACERNVELAKAVKETAILTSDEMEDNKKGVTEAVASYIDTNLDDIVESIDIKSFVEEFLEMRQYILLEEGLDIWKLLKLSLKSANMRGISALKALKDNYSLEEMLMELLSSKTYVGVLGGILG